MTCAVMMCVAAFGEDICRSIGFWGGAAVAFSLFAAIGAIFVYRVYASLSKMAKRIGLASMALLGLLSIGAMIGGTPTLEDKERSCQENNAWANVFGFGTNGVQNTGGFLTGLTGSGGDDGSVPQSLTPQPLTLNPLPAATNYQLPTTNLGWLAFGGYEDWFYLDGGGWCFRFGSNLVERLTVFSCGEISPAPYDASNRISLLGLPLSIVPAANWHLIAGNEEQGTGNYQLPTTNYQLKSLFCHSETPSNTLLLTWQNALVNRDTNLPVTVQAELFPDGAAAFRYDFSGIGDISALSNAEAQIWRDGVLATNYQLPTIDYQLPTIDYQLSTTNCQLNAFFEAPPITGTNGIAEVYARIADGNTNAYYCADVVVSKGPAKIRVEPMEDETNRGLLGAYEIVAMPGETNRLPLLIGPKYTVSAEAAFGSFELVPPPFLPIGADTNGVEWRMFGNTMTVTNITDRLVEVSWPVEFALDEIDATPAATGYALRIAPDWLDGVVTWHAAANTNSPPMRGAPPTRYGGGELCDCGCLEVDDNDVIWHMAYCDCGVCPLEGEYAYGGYCIPFSFDMKDPAIGGDSPGGDGNQPDPNLPSVSVSFDKNVVIFEAPYEDSPGVFVDGDSTVTKLTLSAYGGENGGLISLLIPSGLELFSSVGNMPTYVMPGASVEWKAYYKGIAPSEGVGGTSVGAYITDPLTFEIKNASASLTVVEVKVKAQNTAPQNPCWQRHSYGVCERVVLQHAPDSVNVTWNSAGGLITGIDQLPYSMLKCPAAGGLESLVASFLGVDYQLTLNIIEPQLIVASNITAVATNLPVGIAGHVGMRMEQYVSPFTVSFGRIAIEEVPCEEGFHSGYYSNPSMSNLWSHTYSNGAGLWHAVNMMNRITIDRATCGACPQPWSQGTLIWNIPFGWHPLTANGDVPAMGTLPTKEFATDVRSTITINSTGFVILMKLGHWVSRDIYNEVALDGVVIMEGEQ